MVAGPVTFLMVRARDRVQRGQRRRAAQHLLGQHRVKLDAVELRARERAGLVPDGVGHPGGTEIVQQSGPAECRDGFLGEPKHLGGAGTQLRASPAVSGHVRRFQVDEVRRQGEGVVGSLAFEHLPRFRLKVEHGIPRLHLVEFVEPAGSCATNTSARAGGGHLKSTYFDENFLNLAPAAHVEGLYSCLDYYQNVSDPFSKDLIDQYDKLYPGNARFTAGSACSGLYRGLMLWAAAVKEAGSLRQEDVIKALDHARIAEGPGGPAEMAPGQHHVQMNMYIAQAKNGSFKIVKSLGAIAPKERMVSEECLQSVN